MVQSAVAGLVAGGAYAALGVCVLMTYRVLGVLNFAQAAIGTGYVAAIPEGKRSLAFHLTYRDPERTLTDEAVDQHHQKLVEALARNLGADLR